MECPTEFITSVTDLKGDIISFYDGTWRDCVFIKFYGETDKEAFIHYRTADFDESIVTSQLFDGLIQKERFELIQAGIIKSENNLFVVDYRKGKFVLDCTTGKELSWFSMYPPDESGNKLGHRKGHKHPVKFVDGTNLPDLALVQSYADYYLLKINSGVTTEYGADFVLRLMMHNLGRELPNSYDMVTLSEYIIPGKEKSEYSIENVLQLNKLFGGNQ